MENTKDPGLSKYSQEWFNSLTAAELKELSQKYPAFYNNLLKAMTENNNAKKYTSAKTWWESLTKLQKLELRLLFPTVEKTYKEPANHPAAYYSSLELHSPNDMDTKKAWNNMFNLYQVKKQYMTDEQEKPFIDTYSELPFK